MDGNWKPRPQRRRPPARNGRFELFDFYKDPLDQKNVAADPSRRWEERLAQAARSVETDGDAGQAEARQRGEPRG